MENDGRGIEVRLLAPEDRALLKQTALLEEQIFPDPWSEQEICSTVRQRNTFCAGALEEGRLLGYYLCYFVLDECEIARIAVAPQRRRAGVGQLLFDHMCRICGEKGLTRILLDVRQSNEAAIAFYRKNGFHTDGVRRQYYGGDVPEDAVLMSRGES